MVTSRRAAAVALFRAMPQIQDEAITNRILLSLSSDVFARLKPNLEIIDTVRGQTIYQVDQQAQFLYFVNRGLVSLVKTMHDGRMVEVGAVGPEGVTTPIAVLGIYPAILDGVAQVPGTLLRAPCEAIKSEMAREPRFAQTMRNYVRFAVGQLAQTAACNRLHSLEERSCRWLLMAHDSALADTFSLTHEFLAMMLGVQRPSVTVAANNLQHHGLIRYVHGRVTVTNRQGLEDAACECYADNQAQLNAVFA